MSGAMFLMLKKSSDRRQREALQHGSLARRRASTASFARLHLAREPRARTRDGISGLVATTIRAAMRVFRRRFSERPRRARVAPRRVFDGDDAVGTRRVECTLPSPVRRADVVETRERSRRVEDEEKEKK